MQYFKKLSLLISVLSLCFSSIILATPYDIHSQAGLIRHNMTITVPGNFPGGFQSECVKGESIHSIQRALYCLNDTMISPSAIVTIKVIQNNMNDDQNTITVNHPNGSQIDIVGDCGREPCTLNFKNGSSGFVVSHGHTLGLLSNFIIKGTKKSGKAGILAIDASSIKLGTNTVSGFHTGIEANSNSVISIEPGNQTHLSGNIGGLNAIFSSSIKGALITSENNGICDYSVRDSSSVDIAGAQGTSSSVCADMNGMLRCTGSTFTIKNKYTVLGGIVYPSTCKQPM